MRHASLYVTEVTSCFHVLRDLYGCSVPDPIKRCAAVRTVYLCRRTLLYSGLHFNFLATLGAAVWIYHSSYSHSFGRASSSSKLISDFTTGT
jgi:hypothetical protein